MRHWHSLGVPELGAVYMGDEIGAYSLTVADLLRKQVAVRAESMAVEDARGALSYQALDQRVNRLAHVLVQHGVAMGDRVALLSENRREYLETRLAAAKLEREQQVSFLVESLELRAGRSQRCSRASIMACPK